MTVTTIFCLGCSYLMLTLMNLPQKWLQLNPLFIFIFMTLKPSSCMCVLVVLTFSPFFPPDLFCVSPIVSSSDISMSQGQLKRISFQCWIRMNCGAYGILSLVTLPMQPQCEVAVLACLAISVHDLPLVMSRVNVFGNVTAFRMSNYTFLPFTFLKDKLIHAQNFALLTRSFRGTSICRWPSQTGGPSAFWGDVAFISWTAQEMNCSSTVLSLSPLLTQV